MLGVVVDATAVHDRGASDAQELGYALAVGARVPARADRRRDRRSTRPPGCVEFRYAATDEQFPTIAKLRAARRLWARVLELSGGRAAGEQRQHAVTSRPMMSKYDPWVNMLRTTVAAFAAGVGGADAVTVLPFDSPLGRPDAFGRRIARNTSSLLIAESHVAHVADPAGGAYAVEKLTDDLAAPAGTAASAGSRQRRAASDGSLRRDRRDRRAARGARSRAASARSPGSPSSRTSPRRCPSGEPDEPRSPGPPLRRQLRGAARRARAAAHVFLATMGTVAAHTARATFAANLLAAGGIAVDVAGPTAGADDAGRGVRRPAGRLPRRQRRGVRRVGRRRGRRPARGRRPLGGHRRQAARPRRRRRLRRWASTPSTS